MLRWLVLLCWTGHTLAAASIEKRLVYMAMRDGVRLSTNIFRPAGAGRTPALLVRTPYNKGKELIRSYHPFIDQGFSVVVQDVRGRYDSEGTFGSTMQEETDGFDTLTWIARQPWCNGKIGMLGGSYVGIVQWKAALSGNPHLKAIFPVVSGWDDYVDRFYTRGGAFKLGHRLLWLAENFLAPGHKAVFSNYVQHLPLRTIDRAATGRTIDFLQQALDHPTYDEYWKRRSTRQHIDRVRVPVFLVTGWYDNFAESDLAAFTALSARSADHRLVVGPWGHNMSVPFAGVDLGTRSAAPVRRYQQEWFEYWLNSPHRPPEFPMAPVRIFVMGANQWREEREWPLGRARYTPHYLASRKGANSVKGDGSLLSSPRNPGRDWFVFDPLKPVPTRGGAVCCNPKIFPWGPMDQRAVEERKDVLVFSSEPLKQDLEVTGPIRAVLFVSTSAMDTDFTAKLVDVFPDGHARNLCDGMLRMRYRTSLDRAELVKPGEVYSIVIETGVTSNVFRVGHRIRLEVSSSNFPRFDRNPNTGRAIADETELRTAHQTIYHGRGRASHLLLPVIP